MGGILFDRRTFKALSSDTRVAILEALGERQKTVTELARELDQDKAGVYRHMERLTEAGLARRLDDERKWVYYRLTRKGERALNRNPTRATLALSLASLASFGAAAAALWQYLQRNRTGEPPASEPSYEPGLDTGGGAPGGASDPSGLPFLSDLPDPWLLAIAMGLIALAVAFALAAWRLRGRGERNGLRRREGAR